MLNPYDLRNDFPILRRKIRGKPLIYLDNNATTLKPRQVINAVKNFYENHYSNIHRGVHTLSQEATELFEDSLNEIASFVGIDFEELIPVYNSTDAINLFAITYGLQKLKPGDEVIISILEHHSNMLPWRAIAKYRQLKVKYINVTPDGDIDYEDLAHKLSPRTKVVAITHVSNTLGTIVDIKKVVKLAKEEDAVVFLDAAQSVPHLPVNFRELGVDAAAFSGHKMLGPAGTGGLYVKRDFLDELEPIKSGGDAIRDVTIDDVSWNILPWKFAPGTPNLEGFIGLAEAVRYLKKIGMESVRQHDKYLLSYTIKKAIDELGDKIIIYGPKDVEKRSGAFTFNIRNTSPNVIGLYLDMHGIAVRTGMHCTHPLHYDLSMMSGKRFGTVRASFYIYNTKEEADTLIEALKKFEGA